jgi:hypothetical protein
MALNRLKLPSLPMVNMQRTCGFIEVADDPAPRDGEAKKYLGKTGRFESSTPDIEAWCRAS